MLTIMAVCFALVLEKLWPIASTIDPLLFFRFVCKRMAVKVLHANSNNKQALISGTLGLLLLVVPIVIVVYLIRQFAAYTLVFDILMLWVLLQFRQDIAYIDKAISALKADKKQLAKEFLQQKLCRNTQQLSSVGLCKASIESIYLRYQYQQITGILVYLSLGPIAVLCYRLCYEAQQVWSVKLTKYAYFGKTATKISALFQIIPVCLTNVTFVIISAPKLALIYLQSSLFWQSLMATTSLKHFQQLSLQCLSLALKVNTGGPVQYSQKNQRRLRNSISPSSKAGLTSSTQNQSNSIEPTTNEIKRLIHLINKHLIITLVLLSGISYCLIAV